MIVGQITEWKNLHYLAIKPSLISNSLKHRTHTFVFGQHGELGDNHILGILFGAHFELKIRHLLRLAVGHVGLPIGPVCTRSTRPSGQPGGSGRARLKSGLSDGRPVPEEVPGVNRRTEATVDVGDDNLNGVE